MLDRDCGQGFIPFRRSDQSVQDAICLKRAEFFADLHNRVSGGLLSIADAEKKVAEYDHPTRFHPKSIFDRFWAQSRRIPFLKPALTTK